MIKPKVYKRENDVKKEIRTLLTKHKWFHFAVPAGGFSQSGISDRLALKAGTLLAIEAKFGSNKPSTLQRAFLETINAEGGLGFVVNEKNIDQLVHWLELFDQSVDAVSKGEKVDDNAGASMLNALRDLTVGIVT